MKPLVILLSIALLILFGARLYFTQKEVPFHEDEHIYINRAVFFDLYARGDFKNPLWTHFESDYSKLPDLLYGASLAIQNQSSVSEYINTVGFNTDVVDRRSWNVRYSQEYIPMKELPSEIYQRIEPVRKARGVSLILAIGSLGCVLVIGWLINERLAAIITSVMLVLHPLFTAVTLTVMGDGPLIFFSLAALACSLFWLRSLENKKYILKWAILTGISLGLALSAKLNALLSVVYFFSLVNALLLKRKQHISLAFIHHSLFLAAASGWIAFILLTPQIWSRPFRGFFEMFSQRNAIIVGQQLAVPTDALYNLSERFRSIPSWVFFWHDTYGTFTPNTGFVAIFLIGALVLFLRVKNNPSFLLKAFCLWLGIVSIGTSVLIPLNWNRYYLPIVIMVTFIQAFGISFFLKAVYCWILKLIRYEKNSLS